MEAEHASDKPHDDEFETYARWTREAVQSLGAEVALPAACRGSGSPSTLDWLLERLSPARGELLLDLGGGMGGPGAYAAERTGARVLNLDPSREACVTADTLFGLATAVVSGDRLPLPPRTSRIAWSLGVLCTLEDQPAFLAESARVLSPGGMLGLYVLVRHHDSELPEPKGNVFPTPDRLALLVDRAGLTVLDQRWVRDLPDPGPSEAWSLAARRVEDLIRDNHGREPAYVVAHEQSERISALLDDGAVRMTVLTCRR